MTDMVTIIENDDLDSFLNIFDINTWKTPIKEIVNYADHNKSAIEDFEVAYDNVDCLKYALHCNADKIFNYLLPLLTPDKHGEDYGFPLLAMAIKNNRYDYANSIINHRLFNPYAVYHTTSFRYIETRSNINEHIEFLFNYLQKFSTWDFEDRNLVYSFTHLICYNEETFERCDALYKRKYGNSDLSILNIYQNDMGRLGEEIFNRKYNEFIINKLSNRDIEQIIIAACKDNIYFVQLFKSENAKEGVTHLLKCSIAFQEYFKENEILVSYLPLDCILLLIQNGIDIWKENAKKKNAIDYILNNEDLEEEATKYFINKYPQEIFDRLEFQGRKNNIRIYCYQKLLDEKLGKSDKKTIHVKI